MPYYGRVPAGHAAPISNHPVEKTRKNKLQRCSVCGGLGHKSRTCELAAFRNSENAQRGAELMRSETFYEQQPQAAPRRPVVAECVLSKDQRTLLAAYGLLTMATQSGQLEMPAPSSPAHVRQPITQHFTPLSPRLIA